MYVEILHFSKIRNQTKTVCRCFGNKAYRPSYAIRQEITFIYITISIF